MAALADAGSLHATRDGLAMRSTTRSHNMRADGLIKSKRGGETLLAISDHMSSVLKR